MFRTSSLGYTFQTDLQCLDLMGAPGRVFSSGEVTHLHIHAPQRLEANLLPTSANADWGGIFNTAEMEQKWMFLISIILQAPVQGSKTPTVLPLADWVLIS